LRHKPKHRLNLFIADGVLIHHLFNAHVLHILNAVATGNRLSLNAHATPTVAATLSTTRHCAKTITAAICLPSRHPGFYITETIPAHPASTHQTTMATKKKNSLVANINRKKKSGTSRPKKDSTISPEAYQQMEAGWPKKKSASKKKK
jgi:hypothetical protein